MGRRKDRQKCEVNHYQHPYSLDVYLPVRSNPKLALDGPSFGADRGSSWKRAWKGVPTVLNENQGQYTIRLSYKIWNTASEILVEKVVS